ncbi:MAG: DUF4388 domain-containing protein [Deltaproteobacteria bacterium]|nr:DUF4388 domain-containing protein [Deltaproteobacteria bacterium]
MAFALKFISGKYQGGEFPLRPNREIVIGRSSELDMVLVEDMVSRKHAKIVTSESNVVIQDLGSTNGTFVNGEKIKKARLKEGDRILVGTSILKLIAKSSGGPVDEAEARVQMEEAAKKGKRDSTMSGRVEDVPVPDLLQLFQTSKRSGVLVIKAEQTGRVFLREGRVYYAVIGDDHDLGPQKAFNRIVAWEEGRFELSPPSDEEFMIELDEAPEALIMEALRQLDELRQVRQDLPSVDAVVELEKPIAAPLSDLEPDYLDVLQLVHNFTTHQDVLDQSEQGDLETSQILAHLIQKGYITEV